MKKKHINVFSKCIYMVRVITIADDVYEELKEMKESRNMSFSQILRYLLKEVKSNPGLLRLAGSLDDKKLAKRNYKRIKEGQDILNF